MEQPTTVTKPEGGFVFIRVRQLCRAWEAYQQRRIQLVDLWVWFAAHEVVARRCQVKAGQPVHYRVEELAHIVGGGHSLPASLRRLAQAGLLSWDEQKLTFPDEDARMSDSEALTRMLEQITNSKRRIPIPRRLIRYLAGGCPKVLVATILGHLIRCLYYREGACRPAGRCKATWIAQVFGVSVRQVKQSRKRLEAIGLLQRSLTPQWVLNRYGQGMTVNLQWQEPRCDATPRAAHAETAPPARDATAIRETEADGLLPPVATPSSPTNIPPLPHRLAVPVSTDLADKSQARSTISTRVPTTAATDRTARTAHESPADRHAAGSLSALVQQVQAAQRAGQQLDEKLLTHAPTDAAPAPAPRAERQAFAGAGPDDSQAETRTRAPFSLPSVGQILGLSRRGFASPRREEPQAQAGVASAASVVRETHAGERIRPASETASPAEAPRLRPHPTASVADLSSRPLACSPHETSTWATADADRAARAAHEPPVTDLPSGRLTALYLQARTALRAGQKLDEKSLCLAPADAALAPVLSEELPSRSISAPVNHQTETTPAPALPPHVAPPALAETPGQSEPARRTEVPESGPDSRPAPAIAAHRAPISFTPTPDPHPSPIAPPCAPKSTPIAPPNSHRELSEIGNNQKPGAPSSPGVLLTLFLATQQALREGKVLKGEHEHSSESTHSAADHSLKREEPSSPLVSRNLVKQSPDCPTQAPLPAPTLRHILPHDLRDTGRLLQLYTQAVTAGLSGSAEADRLAFVALAQHVLAYRPNNPGGLFTQLLRKRLFHYATQDDEDSALRRLRRHLHGGTSPNLPPVVETALRRAG